MRILLVTGLTVAGALAVVVPVTGAPAITGVTPPASSVVAVGDIACQPNWPGYNKGKGKGNVCRQKYTGETAQTLQPDQVLILGDVQYEDGYLKDYTRVFDKTWGQRFLDRTDAAANRMWPVPGNHSYRDKDAAGYFAYFNGGTPAKPNRSGVAGTTYDGWYRKDDIPGWTLLALNANCTYLKGGCKADSEQYDWLKRQLQNTEQCTLAYWHEPLFNKGKEAAAHDIRPFWKLLYQAGADLILNGHDHTYQRFPRLNPQGDPDPKGPQQIIIGTGGRSLTKFAKKPSQPSVVTKSATTTGVLNLQLGAGTYSWEFVRAQYPGNGKYHDSGTATCV